MRKNQNSARARIVVAAAAALLLCSWYSSAQEPKPVDYIKICDPYGTGYYYIPGTDTCLKIGGYVDEKKFTAGFQPPSAPAGCSTCQDLDTQIAALQERFNKLEGKGVPKWQDDIAADLIKLREAKAACQKTCGSADIPANLREDIPPKVCDAYGAGYYYIPGSDICLKLGGYIVDERKVSFKGTPQAPSAGCQTCAALDAEIKSLDEEYKMWQAKGGGTLAAAKMKELAPQITKLQELKAGCEKVCKAPPRTAKKQTPGQYYKKEVPPLRTFTPPSQRQKFHDSRESGLRQGGS